MMMVKAGKAVDDTIASVLPYLEAETFSLTAATPTSRTQRAG